MSSESHPVLPKRILVIGGGPTGLVALRNLTERGQFERVELVERRDDVGGVWHFDEPPRRWPSPAYKGLIGNVLPEFLSFSEYPFPPSADHGQPFPTLTETHEYLRSFARPYVSSGAIRLNTEVIRLEEVPRGGGWKVVIRDWNDGAEGQEVEENWDAVVVAIGWYDNPVWPETDGLEEVRKRGLARHAKRWRGPEGSEGKRLLVVGNANSSNEIAAHSAPLTKSPVYQSIRRPAFPGYPSLPDERIVMVAPVAKYIVKSTPEGDKIDVKLTDGTDILDVDMVHVGTGYKPWPEFIHVLKPGDDSETQHTPLISDFIIPHRIPSLHRFILYAYNPSLAFIGAPMVFTPFTIADVASTWLALAWLGETPYPDTIEGRLEFEKARLAAVEKRRAGMDNPSSLMVYSVLGRDEQEYARALKADVVNARPELAEVLPEWNDERTKLREAMHKAKYDALEYVRARKVVE